MPASNGGNAGSSGKSTTAREVAKRIMERTCKGRPYSQEIDGMRGVNYYTTFTCLPG